MPPSAICVIDPAMGSVKRCFLPIGQGAFYCERFKFGENKPINVVFDCGALPAGSMRRCLSDALPSALGGDDTIHLMFLSHLHEDHVNGVEELRNNHKITIKEIRYPAIEDSGDRLMMEYWFQATGHTDGLAYALYRDQPHGDSYPRLLGTNLVPIPVTPPPDGPVKNGEDAHVGPNVVKLADIAQNAGITDDIIQSNVLSEWEFQAFNYLREKDRSRLLERLAAILPSGESVTNDNLGKLWKKQAGKKAIKKAYDALPGGFNANSMTVFSGPVEEQGSTWEQRLECCHERPCPLNSELEPTAPGCLYTGDYEASTDERWNALAYRYATRWNRIGCLQVPHHGACLNFNKRFLDMDAIFVASAGSHNKFGHPNACVQLQFQQARKHLFCVTEQSSSCLCTTIRGFSNNALVGMVNQNHTRITLRRMAEL